MQDIRGDFLERWFIRKERGACWTVGCYRGGMYERGQIREGAYSKEDFLTEGWCFFDSGLIIEGALL